MFGLTEREHAEPALRESDQRYRALVEAAPDVIFTISPQAILTSFNPAFERMTGWPLERWLDKPLHQLVHPEDLSLALDMLARALSDERTPTFELRILASSGEYLFGEFTITPLMDDGEAAGVLGMVRDVTPRRKTEDEIQTRGRILEAVAFAAEQFLAGRAGAEGIQEVLRRLAHAASVDRVAVFQNIHAEDGDVHVCELHSWTDREARTAERASNELQALSYRAMGYDRWVEVLGGGGVISGHVRDFPPNERPWLEKEGYLSIAIVPIFVGGEWWGTISYGQLRSERDWSPAEIRALKAAAGLFGASIHQARSDEALRESEDRYRRLVELSPDAILVHKKGVIEFANAAAARLIGAEEPEELVGQSLLKFVHPDSRPLVLERLHQLQEGRPAPLVAQKFIRLDGRPVDVEVAATPFQHEGETAVQMVARDATDRLRAQDALRASEERYRRLVERIPAIIYTAEFGDKGRWLFVSPQVEVILGFTPDEWMAAPDLWIRQLHPDDAEAILALEERSRRTMEPIQCEYRLFAKDGRVVWVRDDWVVSGQHSGEPLLQGVIFDITERKQAEGQLQEAERTYRTLVEQIPAISYVDVYDPLYAPDMYRTEYVSPQIETMLGYSPEEFIASPDLWYSMIHPEDRDRAMVADKRHYKTGEPLTEEYRLIGRNGRTVWVLDEAALVRDEQGGPRFSQGILYDITARKKAEEDLERALSIEREAAERLRALDELKNTFLHAVSHELRTPLSAVLGLSLTLEREEVQLPAEERKDLVHRLAANARKLDQLLSDLLDLDRLDRGIMEPRRRLTDVAALVRRTVEGSDILGTRPVRVIAQLVVVSIDAPKVERIVENLLANAARHTPADTTIWVRVAPEHEGVLICVEDDGPGVSDDLRETIFEPFRQGPDAPSHSPGVGIGLSLVSKFAELHGGRAWVDQRPGGGASFKVFLPGAAD
ncbi:MAG TPA: PAS domain S-box protein [Actinomycetota bacterium]|nr:PAS domain S-box protein [Actinomycetota bacterium]